MVAKTVSLAFETATALAQRERRWLRHGAHFLEQEAANRLLERLDLIKLAPASVLQIGCSLPAMTQQLAQRYPQAQLTAVDTPVVIDHLKAHRKTSSLGHTLKKWLPHPLFKRNTSIAAHAVEYLSTDFELGAVADESQDLVICNLGLSLSNAPHLVLPHWRRVLRPGGVVLFSCLGPGSFVQIRQILAQWSWPTQMMPLTDMHDFGDMLTSIGFATPVMDQEVLTFTYKTTVQMLNDLRAMGGNAATGRCCGLLGASRYRLLQELLIKSAQQNSIALPVKEAVGGGADVSQAQMGDQAQDALALDVELAYGHAWRPVPKPKAANTQPGLSIISTDLLRKGGGPYNP